MIAEKMKGMVANSSAIRAMFEEGNRLAEIYGAENVFDFSLGNPNVPAPEAVKKAILQWKFTPAIGTDQKAHESIIGMTITLPKQAVTAK